MEVDDFLDHAARTFRKMLKAKATSGGRIITVDFTQLPSSYSFAIPQQIVMEEHYTPDSINALDLIAAMMPGLWGYANNAGLKKVKICSCCGKEHKKLGGAE